MTDVFTVLKADHTDVEALLTKLAGGSGPASGISSDVAGDAEQLVIAESRHEAAEEMYFWPAVRQRVDGGAALADEGKRQENEGKEILDRLRKASPGDGEFEEMVTRFVTAGRQHIAYEEQQVWPKLQAVLTREEADELGSKITTAEKAGPTRPHPKAPDSPGALKTAGVAAAAMDKIRDTLKGRGK